MTRASVCLGGPLNAKRPPVSIVNGQQAFLHRVSTPAPEGSTEPPIVITHRYDLVILDVDMPGGVKARYPVYVADGHDRGNLVADVKRLARLG